MQTNQLTLIVVGDAPASLLKDLEEPLQNQLGLKTSLGKASLSSPSYAFNKDRNQYHANAILRRLAPLREPDGAVLALAEVDLFVPDSPYVFGDADRDTHAAIISSARLSHGSDPLTLRRRLSVEAMHQAGHLVGLSFCDDVKCAMFQATTLVEADRRQSLLCHVCRNELAKAIR